eukprot:Hpha_TRINITY_DN27614_c0_g1::TRINITY_DN27614_c0_g1_i1::g.57392::m.57392
MQVQLRGSQPRLQGVSGDPRRPPFLSAEALESSFPAPVRTNAYSQGKRARWLKIWDRFARLRVHAEKSRFTLQQTLCLKTESDAPNEPYHPRIDFLDKEWGSHLERAIVWHVLLEHAGRKGG